MYSWGIVALKNTLETIALRYNPSLEGLDEHVYCYLEYDLDVLDNMFKEKTSGMEFSKDGFALIEQARELQKEIVTEFFANKNYE